MEDHLIEAAVWTVSAQFSHHRTVHWLDKHWLVCAMHACMHSKICRTCCKNTAKASSIHCCNEACIQGLSSPASHHWFVHNDLYTVLTMMKRGRMIYTLHTYRNSPPNSVHAFFSIQNNTSAGSLVACCTPTCSST